MMIIFLLVVSCSSSPGFPWLLSQSPPVELSVFPKCTLIALYVLLCIAFVAKAAFGSRSSPMSAASSPGRSAVTAEGFVLWLGGLRCCPQDPLSWAAGWASCLFPLFYLTKVIIILVNKHLTPFQLLWWPQARKQGCESHSVLVFFAVTVVCLRTAWSLLPRHAPASKGLQVRKASGTWEEKEIEVVSLGEFIVSSSLRNFINCYFQTSQGPYTSLLAGRKANSSLYSLQKQRKATQHPFPDSSKVPAVIFAQLRGWLDFINKVEGVSLRITSVSKRLWRNMFPVPTWGLGMVPESWLKRGNQGKSHI